MIKKKKKEQHPENKKLGKLYGGIVGSKLGLGAGMAYTIGKQDKISDLEINNIIKNRRELFDIEPEIKIEKVKDIGSKAEIGFNQYPKIHIGNNEFIVRHEMGHIEDYYKKNKSKFDKALKKGKTGNIKSYTEALDLLSKENELNDKLTNIKSEQRIYKLGLNTEELGASKVEDILKDLDNQKKIITEELKKVSEKTYPLKKHVKMQDKDLIARNVVKPALKNIGTSALHSNAVRSKIRELNDGRSKIIDKSMDVLDNPIQGVVSMGVINNLPVLIRENIASSKALKGLIDSKGLKQGLKQGLPLYALQQGTYIAGGIAGEASKRMAVNTIEDKIKKKKEKRLEKKACYKETIYQEAFNEMR